MSMRSFALIPCALFAVATATAGQKAPGTPVNEKVNCQERSVGRLPYDPQPAPTAVGPIRLESAEGSTAYEGSAFIIDPLYPTLVEVWKIYGRMALDWFASLGDGYKAAENREPPLAPEPPAVCPYFREIKDPNGKVVCIEGPPATVIDNLAKLEKAEKLYKQGEFYRGRGDNATARVYYEQVKKLCPGSRLEQMAQKQLEINHTATRFLIPNNSEIDDASELCEHDHECTQHEIEQRLRQKVSIDFQKLPLDQVMTEFRDLLGVNVIIDRKALDEEGISAAMPVTLKLENVAAQSAIRLAVEQARLTFVVSDEVVKVTTPSHARGKLVQKMYPVKDLIAATVKRSAADGTKTPPGELLTLCITNSIAPQTWSVMGGNGTVEYFAASDALIVNQTPDVQEQIAEFLAGLRKLHAQQKSDGGEEQEPQASNARTEVQVAELLEACQRAFTGGRYVEAEKLARQAKKLDPECVAANALVYRTHLLIQLQDTQKTGNLAVRSKKDANDTKEASAKVLRLEKTPGQQSHYTVTVIEASKKK